MLLQTVGGKGMPMGTTRRPSCLEPTYDYVDRQGSAFVAELLDFCAMPAIASLGVGLHESAAWIVDKIEELGGRARLVPTRGDSPVVLGVVGQGPRSLLFYNHYDVQPAEPGPPWRRDPFHPWVEDDLILGRGVADNRGNIIARLKAIESYQATVGPLPLRLILCIEGEEEVGSPHLADFVSDYSTELEADGCLWEGGWKDAEGHPVLYCGVKGLLHIELRASGQQQDLHAMWSSIIPGATWRLVHALTLLADRDGTLNASLLPDRHESLAFEAAHLRKIPFDEALVKLNLGVARYLRDMTGLELIDAYIFGPACSITTLKAGHMPPGAKTVLPAEAIARVAIYTHPDTDPLRLCDGIQDYLAHHGFEDIEVHPLTVMAGARSSPSSEVARSAMSAARAVYPAAPVLYPVVPGAGPVRHFVEKPWRAGSVPLAWRT